MKEYLYHICFFITSFNVICGYPLPLVTGFSATATARLTAQYERREIVPTPASSYLKIVVPTDSSLLVDMRQGSKLFVQMSKKKRSIRERRSLPLANPSPKINAPTTIGSKRSQEEFVLDNGTNNEEAAESSDDDDEEEDDEDITPTDATSLVQDTETEEVEDDTRAENSQKENIADTTKTVSVTAQKATNAAEKVQSDGKAPEPVANQKEETQSVSIDAASTNNNVAVGNDAASKNDVSSSKGGVSNNAEDNKSGASNNTETSKEVAITDDTTASSDASDADVGASDPDGGNVEVINNDEIESGSGLSEFENTLAEPEDPDEDNAQPTGVPDRKTHIRQKPKQDFDRLQKVLEKRKMIIARQQDAEMNRLMRLESDIEDMSKDLSIKKRKRNKIVS